jgi:hypothetical protein
MVLFAYILKVDYIGIGSVGSMRACVMFLTMQRPIISSIFQHHLHINTFVDHFVLLVAVTSLDTLISTFDQTAFSSRLYHDTSGLWP